VLVPRLRIPYPILLVLGGLALGFVPGMPELQLPPDLVLVGVLPPLLYGAAFFTSLRDLRANKRPVGFLAVGLVLLTTVAVAVVAHAVVPGLPWAPAFVLGAIVSPTDPIAATAIMQSTRNSSISGLSPRTQVNVLSTSLVAKVSSGQVIFPPSSNL
jgi:CPA1 family monovalent cation:H+ antiporter